MPSTDAKKALPVYEFYFHCQEDFRAMRPLDKEGRVRRCDACEKNVYQVSDAAELAQRTAARECVSLAESVAAELFTRLPASYWRVREPDIQAGRQMLGSPRLTGKAVPEDE